MRGSSTRLEGLSLCNKCFQTARPHRRDSVTSVGTLHGRSVSEKGNGDINRVSDHCKWSVMPHGHFRGQKSAHPLEWNFQGPSPLVSALCPSCTVILVCIGKGAPIHIPRISSGRSIDLCLRSIHHKYHHNSVAVVRSDETVRGDQNRTPSDGMESAKARMCTSLR